MSVLRPLLAVLAFAAVTGVPRVAVAQEQVAPQVQPAETAHGAHAPPAAEKADFITPHITDSYEMEIPYWKPPFAKELCLGRHLENGHCGPLWDPVQIGGWSVNFSPTKHVLMLILAAGICVALLVGAASAHKRHTHAVGRPKGFAAGIEGMVLYLRNEVILPNVGHHGDAYVPYLLSVFFFILFANLLGLIPYGSTATGNIAVTGMMALITFVVVEISGIRALGPGYLSTLFYWNKDLNIVMRVIMFLVMSPVEMIGKLTKPFALMIRLFANMTAGHIVVLAFIGLIFTFGSYLIGLAPLAMAVGIMLLELFVAFLQAFIFTLLSAVFIGQIREAHH